jgi:DnaJ-class molecular chaperone
MFIEIKKAYGCLIDPFTKIIYDQYGDAGLLVYEKNKTKFETLRSELRSIQQEIDEDPSNAEEDISNTIQH